MTCVHGFVHCPEYRTQESLYFSFSFTNSFAGLTAAVIEACENALRFISLASLFLVHSSLIHFADLVHCSHRSLYLCERSSSFTSRHPFATLAFHVSTDSYLPILSTAVIEACTFVRQPSTITHSLYHLSLHPPQIHSLALSSAVINVCTFVRYPFPSNHPPQSLSHLFTNSFTDVPATVVEACAFVRCPFTSHIVHSPHSKNVFANSSTNLTTQ